MTVAPTPLAVPPRRAVALARLGVVRYLNTRPLIDGLESLEGLSLRPEVPARLIALLLGGEVDAALCSVVDYQAAPEELVILPAGALGSFGETLTVRLFSRVPFEEVRRLHADAESHTSVVLARLLLASLHGAAAEVEPWKAPASWGGGALPECLLLIGDKVVNAAPPEAEYPHQMDLGKAWHRWTGMPFVFATWMTTLRRAEEARGPLLALNAVLDHRRRLNRRRLDLILDADASRRGWPRAEAERYLKELLCFSFGPPQIRAMEHFFERASQAGLLPRCRPLRLLAG